MTLDEKGIREVLAQEYERTNPGMSPGAATAMTWEAEAIRDGQNGAVIAAAIAACTRIRDAAYEEAAKVADGEMDNAHMASPAGDAGTGSRGYADACRILQIRIRSLSKPLEYPQDADGRDIIPDENHF